MAAAAFGEGWLARFRIEVAGRPYLDPSTPLPSVTP